MRRNLHGLFVSYAKQLGNGAGGDLYGRRIWRDVYSLTIRGDFDGGPGKPQHGEQHLLYRNEFRHGTWTDDRRIAVWKYADPSVLPGPDAHGTAQHTFVPVEQKSYPKLKENG